MKCDRKPRWYFCFNFQTWCHNWNQPKKSCYTNVSNTSISQPSRYSICWL